MNASEWDEAWEKFAAQERYAGSQKQYLWAVKAKILAGLPWEEYGLPEPMVGNLRGAAIPIPGNLTPADALKRIEAYRKSRQPHWMDSVGDFWVAFDTEKANRFWLFCQKQKSTFGNAASCSEGRDGDRIA
ncbi:MAG: hypothetical protein N2690_11915 [Rhodocyclaceae bacterium]|nr:hypothetical protein [Rhodocyclaceae bacterium]